jgi:mannose-6-phosphate isomerase
MTKDEALKYGLVPLKQKPNRVWRTYLGGALIDKWQKTILNQDGNLSEEWIMSTIVARGKERPLEEGLSRVITPEGEVLLSTIIATDPVLFLGERIAKKFGAMGILIKMLDSAERLTIQVHPDKEYARTMFNSPFGKTESWYILGGRELNGEKSCIYLGFKEGVTSEQWENLFRTQNIQGMLNCLHRFEVKEGDAFMIYGGVPHVIGAGCFLMELQEPTDYTMRVEKITPNGLIINDDLIHQGIGEEKMLKCFHYQGCSYEEALKRWKIEPEVVESNEDYRVKTIFNEKHTDCFALNELELKGRMIIEGNRDFYVAVIYSGSGIISCNGEELLYEQGDKLFFPAQIDQVTWEAESPSKILLCYPPK